jgi:ferredoxin-type protein NapG
MNRRRFFREALGELIKPLSKAAAPIERAVHQLGALDRLMPVELQRAQHYPLPVWQRPPGALPESSFHHTCSRCGECVRVCPAQCIKIEPDGRGEGLPFIDPNEMPCVLCDGLLCMHKCPSGALLPTLLADIDMGTAQWHESLCLRSHGNECTICVDQCPVGSVALEFIDGKVCVHEAGCTGCGVCQHSCPTSPKSITVIPREQRDAANSASGD